MSSFIIRNTRPEDWRATEEVTREAFWNLFVPGCSEHYLLHLLRENGEAIGELDFVAEQGGHVVGNIVFSRSYIQAGDGARFDTVTFGPLCAMPGMQNLGIGGALVQTGLEKAAELGYKAVVIYGNPAYYSRFGFRAAKEFGVSNPQGRYPAAHQILELEPGVLDGITGAAFECQVFQLDEASVAEFDKGFAPREKAETETQKEFARIAGLYL